MPRVSSRYWERVWNYRAHYIATICGVTCDNPTYNKLWEWRRAGEISIKKAETIGG